MGLLLLEAADETHDILGVFAGGVKLVYFEHSFLELVRGHGVNGLVGRHSLWVSICRETALSLHLGQHLLCLLLCLLLQLHSPGLLGGCHEVFSSRLDFLVSFFFNFLFGCHRLADFLFLLNVGDGAV